MLKKTAILFSLIVVILTGCTTPRQMTLFVGDGSYSVMPIPEYIIQPGDMLHIEFYAVNSTSVTILNSAGCYYLVNRSGKIIVPVIGEVQMAGKTEKEAVADLISLANMQVQDPMVHLSISDASVSFLGEVRAPGLVSVVHPIPFTEALARVGGLTKNAKCDDVIIKRVDDGKLIQYHINLLTDEIFSSPCYYLKKGDVVYVAPRHSVRY